MKTSKFNIVTDGQWGSCGKGLITSTLAYYSKPEILSTTNMANAGHTAVNSDGEAFIAKALPSAAILNKWLPDYEPDIMVGPSAAFNLEQLLKEIDICNVGLQTYIHPRAGVITEAHRIAESEAGGTKHVASTMQGCGTFLSDKIMRKAELLLAKDYEELSSFVGQEQKLLNKYYEEPKSASFAMALIDMMNNGSTALHEGSQGFSLDINHGSHYPYCTSRSTTAMQNATDMGVPNHLIGDIYLVIRPYPIRVGNVVEDGLMVGYSGDCYEDHSEMSWEEVAKNAGAPVEVTKGELTTVTKRLRRVFSFSAKQLEEATAINGANKIALNFANYIDWSCFGTNDFDALPSKVHDFIKKVEDIAGIPVTIVGTGPQINHVCMLET
jgi:adenylosuccinate synthase